MDGSGQRSENRDETRTTFGGGADLPDGFATNGGRRHVGVDDLLICDPIVDRQLAKQFTSTVQVPTWCKAVHSIHASDR